jgi:RES domain-containing protein
LARANSQPGRWHSAGDGPTQYLAMSTNAAWAELIRNEELTTEEEVALVGIKMWAVQIERALVGDYSTLEKADAAGFDPEALIDDDHSRAQVEGTRLRAAGYHGVLAPSAALPGVGLCHAGDSPRQGISACRPSVGGSAL